MSGESKIGVLAADGETAGALTAEKAANHMPTMVERVAMAICNWHGCPPADFFRMVPVERELALSRARAAIEALRNPSRKMRQAYKNALKNHIDNLPEDTRAKAGPFGYRVGVNEKLDLRWSAMLDAALATHEAVETSKARGQTEPPQSNDPVPA